MVKIYFYFSVHKHCMPLQFRSILDGYFAAVPNKTVEASIYIYIYNHMYIHILHNHILFRKENFSK